MIDKEKQILGLCIKKYRTSNFTQKELTNGICSKYTLSRLENGIYCKPEIYHQLLERLGFYYKNTMDVTNTLLLFKEMNVAIETNNFNLVYLLIHKLDEILNKYDKHIYFEELKYYMNFLKIHYLKEEKIEIIYKDLCLLPHLDKSIRICIMHVLCENILFFNDSSKLIEFIAAFSLEREQHILIDFFLMAECQYNADIIKADTILKNYNYLFVEENNYYQSIRFNLIFSLGFIQKNKETAIQIIEKAKRLYEKTQCSSNYMYFYYFANIILYIHSNQFEEALRYTKEGLQKFPKFYARFIPLLIFLSLIQKCEVNKCYLMKTDNELCNRCIDVYMLSITKDKPEKEMLTYINRNLPKCCGRDNSLLPLIYIMRKEVIYLVEQSFCYRNALKFDTLVKKYTNEKEHQI